MVSETITKNDLIAILNEVLPPTPSEYKKLLWTNSSPSAAFAAQTIGLNLSEYDEVEIVATFLGNIVNTYSVRCPVGAGSNLAYQLLNTETATNASTFINGVARDFSVNTSGITFGNGQMTYNGNAYTNWSDRAIPYKIYGIKYERVAPPQVEFPNYSTEEQQVGTWIDGKPIYRKVIPTSLTAGINSITAPSNIDTFVTLRGMEKESGGAQAPIPKAHNSTFAYQIGMYYSGGYIYIEVGSNLTNITSAYIICEYTKTTD